MARPWMLVAASVALAACGEASTNAGSAGSAGSGGSAGAGGQSGAPAVEGTGVFDRIVLHTEFYSEGAAVGDLDLDGTLDVVAGPFWYEGPDFTARHELYPPVAFDPKGYSDNFFAWTRDLDDDGWLDVVTVGFPGQQAAWYENPKLPGTHWPRHLIFEVVENESPAWVDLTGDGRPELLFSTAGRLGWAEPATEPTAPWVFHPLSPVTGFAAFTHGLGAGDLNGDQRLDVLEASGWWEQPPALAGDPIWTRHDRAWVPGGAQMYAFDVDTDADADVVTTREAHGYGISWFERIGESFVEHVIAPADPTSTEGPILHEPHALAIADMNGDGSIDLVSGERFWGHVPAGDPNFSEPARLFWFELVRDGTSTKFVPHAIDDASGVGTQVTAEDANGDGVPDVVVANKKGAYVFLQRVEPGAR